MKEAPRDHIACEAMMLHQSSVIQGGCDLILMDPDTQAIVGINETLYRGIGRPQALAEVIQAKDCGQLTGDLTKRGSLAPRIVTRNDDVQIWARPYRTQNLVGIEFTPKDEPLTIDQYSNHFFARVVKDLSHHHELSKEGNNTSNTEYFQMLARGVRYLTKFDRVMIYKFDPDWNGEVIAEDVRHGSDKFFGLKFPSSDIPRPARDMFLRNKVRQIIDVNADTEPMISPVDESPFSFDQVDTAFRYSSPIHLDYLRNMGVTASLTISIQVGGRLWGLLSCHHQSGPHRISLSQLSLCQVLGDLTSNHIARREEQRENTLNARVNRVLSDISAASISANSENDFAMIVIDQEKALLGILGADGLQFESETANWILGNVPTSEQVLRIDQLSKNWLRDQQCGLLATADLAGIFGDRANVDQVKGGLLYSHSWDNKTCLKVFRKPQKLEEVWAGDPDAKDRYPLDNTTIMHPRNSFESFKSIAKDRSDEWQQEEITAAEVIQVGLRNVEMSFHKSLRERQLRHSNAEMRNALMKADHSANHDPLTGLLNRRGLEAFTSGLVQREHRKDRIWFCHIDLDFFKRINDELGHAAGDAMLVRVADALQENQLKGSKAARIGGDEFALLLAGNLNMEEAREICTDFMESIARPMTVDDQDISCGCTIGLTDFTPGQANIERLLQESDLALYHGKRIGRGRVIFFSKDMLDVSSQRRHQEADLLRAITAREFTPYFQPQYDCKSGKIVGFEALSRWRHPKRGILQPAEFMTLASELGVLGDIDKLIFQKAVDYQNEWLQATGEIVHLSVNVSVDRLQSLDFMTDLEKLGSRTKHISLELLESIYLDDHEADYEGVLQRLRNTGVAIEIDDFGTGQTSILAVISVRPDRLKIDKRLIDPIVEDGAARGLVKAIMDIGRQLGIQIIAEGVETRDQFRILQRMKCDRVQGYYFSKPVAAVNVKEDFLEAV